MAFLGVEFEDGLIAVVCKEWLTPRKGQIFWPPYKKQEQYYRSLKSQENPNEETWPLYRTVRKFFATDEYDKALKKIKEAEVTSDLQSDADEESRKRKRKSVSRRLLYEDSSDEDENISLHPRPPALKKTVCVSENSNDDDSSQNFLPQPLPIIERRKVSSVSTINSASTSTVLTSSPAISFVSDEEQGDGADLNKAIFRLLHQIKEQNRHILKYIKQQNISTACGFPEIPVKLPLKSESDIKLLENHLSQRENSLALSDYLASVGGKDGTSLANNILRRCLTNELACSYSFRGKGEKKAFSDLSLRMVIVGAVKNKYPALTEREIEDCIKVWLKHSPQRFKVDTAKNRNRKNE